MKKLVAVLVTLIILTGLSYTSYAEDFTDSELAAYAQELMIAVGDIYDPPLPYYHPLKPYHQAVSSDEHAALGLDMYNVELWENGLRTVPDDYGFEWWYFDAHLDDGRSIVIVFYTKPQYLPEETSAPQFSISIVSPDGTETRQTRYFSVSDAYFAEEKCNIVMGGDNYFRVNDDGNFEIKAATDDFSVDLVLVPQTPAYRPGTGHLYFEENYFAWLCQVPSGEVTGFVEVNGEETAVSGSGYHDHNWGNFNVANGLKNWWWGRAEVGPYTLVAVDMRIRNAYGQTPRQMNLIQEKEYQPVFFLMDENGAIIDATYDWEVTHVEENLLPHDDPDYPVFLKGLFPTKVTYNLSLPGTSDTCTVSFEKIATIASRDLLDARGATDTEKLMATVLLTRPWYTRFKAACTLDFSVHVDGKLVEYSGSSDISTLEFYDLGPGFRK